MSQSPNWTNSTIPQAPVQWMPEWALYGVRTRRMMASVIDFFFITLLCMGIWFLLGIMSLGLLWFMLPPLFPLVAFFYNGLGISGSNMATPGMRAMDLQVQLTNGARAPFLNAAVHAVLYYLSWCFPPIFLVSLLDPDKRCLHDMLSGLIVTRRAI